MIWDRPWTPSSATGLGFEGDEEFRYDGWLDASDTLHREVWGRKCRQDIVDLANDREPSIFGGWSEGGPLTVVLDEDRMLIVREDGVAVNRGDSSVCWLRH